MTAVVLSIALADRSAVLLGDFEKVKKWIAI